MSLCCSAPWWGEESWTMSAVRWHLQYLKAQKWMAEPPALEVAGTSTQDDCWSCGHRVVITANQILSHMATGASLPASVPGPSTVDIDRLILVNGVSTQSDVQAAPSRVLVEDDDDDGAEEPDCPKTPERRKRDLSQAAWLDLSGGSSRCHTPPAVKQKLTRAPRLGQAAGPGYAAVPEQDVAEVRQSSE